MEQIQRPLRSSMKREEQQLKVKEFITSVEVVWEEAIFASSGAELKEEGAYNANST
jgi:hypothetical protein